MPLVETSPQLKSNNSAEHHSLEGRRRRPRNPPNVLTKHPSTEHIAPNHSKVIPVASLGLSSGMDSQVRPICSLAWSTLVKLRSNLTKSGQSWLRVGLKLTKSWSNIATGAWKLPQHMLRGVFSEWCAYSVIQRRPFATLDFAQLSSVILLSYAMLVNKRSGAKLAQLPRRQTDSQGVPTPRRKDQLGPNWATAGPEMADAWADADQFWPINCGAIWTNLGRSLHESGRSMFVA